MTTTGTAAAAGAVTTVGGGAGLFSTTTFPPPQAVNRNGQNAKPLKIVFVYLMFTSAWVIEESP